MAPLLLGGPPSKFDAVDIQTYTNPEVIAVNQDPLMKQGRIVEKSLVPLLPYSNIIWARNLSDGSVAIVFVNSGWLTRTVTCGQKCWSHLPFKTGTTVTVRDLWKHAPAEEAVAIVGSPYSVSVGGTGESRMFKFIPAEAASPQYVEGPTTIV